METGIMGYYRFGIFNVEYEISEDVSDVIAKLDF